MKITTKTRRLTICHSLLLGSLSFLFACARPSFLVGIGTDGRYQQAKEEITRRRGGDMDVAISNLEGLVVDDPTYKDSLTLLGRAYYAKRRFADARAILERAVSVNQEDEIAWLVLGSALFRTGDDVNGLKAVRGGITLLSKASGEGYRGYQYWDRSGRVRGNIRRAVFVALKGTEEKENLVSAVENVLRAVDEEEWYQQIEVSKERRLLAQ